jgi:hypothetical protein
MPLVRLVILSQALRPFEVFIAARIQPIGLADVPLFPFLRNVRVIVPATPTQTTLFRIAGPSLGLSAL